MSNLILYTQPGCSQCRMVHMLLDKKKIEYTECQDVDKMKELGIQHTPTLDTGAELLTGKPLLTYINMVK